MWRLVIVLGIVGGAWGSATEVVFAAEVCRHGARAPNQIFDFHKDYWRDYAPGQLTALGLRQGYLLGLEMRRRYVYDTPLLNSTYSAPQIWVQSTNVDRAIETAFAQLTGLFPPHTGLKVEKGRKLRPPLGVRDVDKIERELGDYALPFRVRPVPIHADEGDHVLHGYEGYICPRMSQIRAELKLTPEYQQLEERAEVLLREMTCLVHEKGLSTAKKLYSGLVCDQAQGNPLPAGLDLVSLRDLYQDAVLLPFSSREAQVLSCSEFFKKLLQQAQERIDGGAIRFAVYSAHDYTLVSIMVCMGVEIDEIPPFASTLLFELYSDLSLKLLYNGKPLAARACPFGACQFSAFQTYTHGYIVEDIEQACELH